MQSVNRNRRNQTGSNAMQFLKFIMSSWVEILLDALLCVSIYFILNTVELDFDLIVFIILSIALVGLIRLIVRYESDKRFWADVDNLIHAGVDAFDLNVLIHEPQTYQGRITYAAVDALISQYAHSIQNNQSQLKEQKEFIETWIHEIKTPLAASYLIADHYPGASAIELKRQLSRIEAYTEQALFYARMQSLDRDFIVKPARVLHMVNEAIKSRSLFLIENDIHIKTHNLNHEVLCDEKWMIFIIGQLIDNAIKYCDSTKEISYLEFSLSKGSGDVEDTYILSVIDNGIGISQSDLLRVFDKGFTGVNGRMVAKEKATGIGLYLVERLAHKMGVQIDITSSEGDYTKVDIIFNRLSEDIDI